MRAPVLSLDREAAGRARLRRPPRWVRAAVLWSGVVLAGTAPVLGQDVPAPLDAEASVNPRPQPMPASDPYGAAESMGYAATGAMWWTPNLPTASIEEALGSGPLLWVQTEHFRIGSNLGLRGMPRDSEGRQRVRRDLAALHERVPRMDPETDQLDPWLQLHGFAFELERLHKDFEAWVGPPPHTVEGHGPPLQIGILLLQTPSDLGRFHRAFHPTAEAGSTQGRGVVLGNHGGAATLATSPFHQRGLYLDARRFKAHVIHHVTALLLRSCWQVTTEVPLWLEWGLGTHYSHRWAGSPEVPPAEAVFSEVVWAEPWAERVLARARHRTVPPAAEMFAWREAQELDLSGALACWSKVEFMLATERDGLRRLLLQLKRDVPPCRSGSPTRCAFWSHGAVARAWGHKSERLDERWRTWVGRGGIQAR